MGAIKTDTCIGNHTLAALLAMMIVGPCRYAFWSRDFVFPPRDVTRWVGSLTYYR